MINEVVSSVMTLNLTSADKQLLLQAIASRSSTTAELTQRYGTTVKTLKEFVNAHLEELEQLRQMMEEESPDEIALLDKMWITSKPERVERYQAVCDLLYDEVMEGSRDAVVLRELRSYLLAVANELGQLMHRGSGDAGLGDSLSIDIQGVDINQLR